MRRDDLIAENLSLLLSSGMPVTAAMEALSDEARHYRGTRTAINILKSEVENGSPFWKALEKSGLFGHNAIMLIKIGEQSGRLSENLKLVAGMLEKDKIFRSKINSAMMYPAFVFSVTVIVGIVLVSFILPKLGKVFAEMRLELPLATRLLIAFGQFVDHYSLIVFPVFIVVTGLIIFFVFFFSKTKFIGEFFLFSMPGTGRLFREMEIARFGYLMGTTLKAGLPISRSLRSVSEAAFSGRYRKFYRGLHENINEGNSFRKSFSALCRNAALVPVPLQQMIMSSEQSGRLTETLLRIGESYESRIEITTKNLSVIIEPILLVFVWLGVVSVALAVILPIYNLVGSLK